MIYDPFLSDLYSLGLTFLQMKLISDKVGYNELEKA
jgi:hypothetical protein